MRKTSHMQSKEPILEKFLSIMRFNQALKYVQKNDIVADIGCGYHGYLLSSIADKIKKGIGYDLSVSKLNLPKNIFLKQVNINKKIDSKKNYFDTVIALAILEHVENPVFFIKRLKSLLKKNGKIVITTPHRRGKKLLEFLSYTLKMVSTDEISDHKNYFDEKKLQKLLLQNGFRIIKIKTFEFGVNLLAVAQKI